MKKEMWEDEIYTIEEEKSFFWDWIAPIVMISILVYFILQVFK